MRIISQSLLYEGSAPSVQQVIVFPTAGNPYYYAYKHVWLHLCAESTGTECWPLVVVIL